MNFMHPVTRAVGRSILKTKKNSPHIFFVGGVVGILGSTFLACRATLKLETCLDEVKYDLEQVKPVKMIETDEEKKEYYRDLGYVYGKAGVKLGRLYGPSIALGVVSVSALAGSHIQLARRNTALTAAFAAVTKAYDEYRIRVQEELGASRELDIYYGVVDEDVKDADGKKLTSKFADPDKLSPYARFFDETSTQWQKDGELNRLFVQCQQNYANHLLQARGHVFLNEVYDSLGMERSKAGQVVGWVRDGDGDNYIDFGMFDIQNRRFVNNLERSILLDFNVDGNVLDLI